MVFQRVSHDLTEKKLLLLLMVRNMTKNEIVSYKTHKNWSRDILSGSRVTLSTLFHLADFFRAMAQMKLVTFSTPIKIPIEF